MAITIIKWIILPQFMAAFMAVYGWKSFLFVFYLQKHFFLPPYASRHKTDTTCLSSFVWAVWVGWLHLLPSCQSTDSEGSCGLKVSEVGMGLKACWFDSLDWLEKCVGRGMNEQCFPFPLHHWSRHLTPDFSLDLDLCVHCLAGVNSGNMIPSYSLIQLY